MATDDYMRDELGDMQMRANQITDEVKSISTFSWPLIYGAEKGGKVVRKIWKFKFDFQFLYSSIS